MIAEPPASPAIGGPWIVGRAAALDAEIGGLLEPFDAPYGWREACDRARRLWTLYARCEADPEVARLVLRLADRSHWASLALLTWTSDSSDPRMKVKPFPPLWFYREMSNFCDRTNESGLWTEPVFCLEKSRQISATWWAVMRMDWWARQSDFAQFPLISKKEEDAKDHLQRIRHNHAGMPDFARRAWGLEGVDAKTSRITYPNKAFVQALPQEGEQVRSMVVSMALLDEAAFQSEFEKNYQALMAFGAKAQVLVVTTPTPSWVERLYRDRLDGEAGGREMILEGGPRMWDFPALRGLSADRAGVEVWRGKKSRIACAAVGFWADPTKRTPEFIEAARARKPKSQFVQEFLLNWEARGGQVVFSEWDRSVHVTKSELRVYRKPGTADWYLVRRADDGELLVNPCWLLRGIDHGTTNFAGALWVAVEKDTLNWFVYRDYRVRDRTALVHRLAIAEMSEKQEWETEPIYDVDVIDAMQGLADVRGHVDRMYKDLDQGGFRPLMYLSPVKKGSGSRQEGVDRIRGMMLATLADHPDHALWKELGYAPSWLESFRGGSKLYVDPRCLGLIHEIEEARYDKPKDPSLAGPETTLNTQDATTDVLRYLLRSGGHMLRESRAMEIEGD